MKYLRSRTQGRITQIQLAAALCLAVTRDFLWAHEGANRAPAESAVRRNELDRAAILGELLHQPTPDQQEVLRRALSHPQLWVPPATNFDSRAFSDLDDKAWDYIDRLVTTWRSRIAAFESGKTKPDRLVLIYLSSALAGMMPTLGPEEIDERDLRYVNHYLMNLGDLERSLPPDLPAHRAPAPTGTSIYLGYLPGKRSESESYGPAIPMIESLTEKLVHAKVVAGKTYAAHIGGNPTSGKIARGSYVVYIASGIVMEGILSLTETPDGLIRTGVYSKREDTGRFFDDITDGQRYEFGDGWLHLGHAIHVEYTDLAGIFP